MSQKSLEQTLDRANSDVVLIVDDVPDNLAMLHDALEESGYTVLVAASREEALALVAAQGAVDLVVTDFHLAHDVSGLDVIHDLRQRDASPFQAIVVTGDTSAAIRELPADLQLRLLSKPVHADELLALIRDLLP